MLFCIKKKNGFKAFRYIILVFRYKTETIINPKSRMHLKIFTAIIFIELKHDLVV